MAGSRGIAAGRCACGTSRLPVRTGAAHNRRWSGSQPSAAPPGSHGLPGAVHHARDAAVARRRASDHGAHRPALFVRRPARGRVHGAAIGPAAAVARPGRHGDRAERAAFLRAVPPRGRSESSGLPPAAALGRRAAHPPATSSGGVVPKTAQLHGFSSSQHFSTLFRRAYNVTPRAWRQAMKLSPSTTCGGRRCRRDRWHMASWVTFGALGDAVGGSPEDNGSKANGALAPVHGGMVRRRAWWRCAAVYDQRQYGESEWRRRWRAVMR